MLSTKNSRTLAAVFEQPVRADVRYPDVETLLLALGAEVKQGAGSRVRFSLHGRRLVFHSPHPQPKLAKDAVRSIRRFLAEAGVEP